MRFISRTFQFRTRLRVFRYFINGDDEIRSIEDPDYYFKFFIDRNPRVCARQRFDFNRTCSSSSSYEAT